MAGLWEMLFGNKDQVQQLPTMNQGQMQGLEGILSQMKGMQGQGGAYSGAQNYLSKILSGDPGSMAEFEAPYRQEFEQKTIPGLAERFAGMGGGMGGGLSSSGFGQALGGAGANLQSQLAGIHGNLRQGASGQAMGQFNQLAGMGLGAKPFENLHRPGTGGLVGNLMQGLGGGLGMGAGMSGGGGIMQLLMQLLGGGGGMQQQGMK